MPLLVRTPEQIMREEPNKDLFYIEFNDLEQVSDPNDPPGRIELIEWFSTYLPNIKIEFLAPSEKSGYIIGGINGRTR